MELTSFPLSGRTIVYIALSLTPALVAFVVLAGVARGRRSSLWLVPGWLAAAALAPVIATFFAVRLTIASFQDLATSGGGLGAVSAGMWEAAQPLIAASYLACALAAVTLVIAIRSVVNQGDDDSESSSRATIAAIVVLVLAAVAVGSTTALVRNVNTIIIDVIDPRAPQTGEIAGKSTQISRALVVTAATSVGMTLTLLLAIVLTAAVRPRHEPRAAFGRVLVLIVLVVVIAMLANALAYRSWAARLHETAITGHFTR